MKSIQYILTVLILTSYLLAHSVDLKWKASPTVGVTYSVYRKMGTTYSRRAANIKTLAWTDTNVKSGKTYSYVVRAVKKSVESDDSNVAITTIP
jgi:fibronectin type 3 domain-containing protein